MKIVLGCDPEVFLIDAAGGFVSSIGIIGGSKRHPRPLPIGDGFAVQEDNVALEYNIPPAESKEQFRNHINRVMSFLSDEVSKLGLKFSDKSAVSFPMSQLGHPDAMRFGCEPDFNAWENGKINPKPRSADMALRSAGGHVHVGYKFDSKKDVQDATKFMDLFLSVPAVFMDDGTLRKELYGKPGAFRYKPYGFEYRSLSNFWIFDNKLIDWVSDSTFAAMNAWQNKTINVDEDKELILEAINGNNKLLAERLVDKYQLQVV